MWGGTARLSGFDTIGTVAVEVVGSVVASGGGGDEATSMGTTPSLDEVSVIVGFCDC